MLKSKILGIVFLVGFLSGCGSTVIGVGQDIQRWGENWNKPSEEVAVPVQKVSVEKETK
tara:strand:- start:236 stop:412 length:177 start_codon:yes stop_codon:yes gene_type:complete